MWEEDGMGFMGAFQEINFRDALPWHLLGMLNFESWRGCRGGSKLHDLECMLSFSSDKVRNPAS